MNISCLENNLNIDTLVAQLKKGQVIIIPTETVYGIIADSQQPTAIERIYTIKNRPKNKALSLLLQQTLTYTRGLVKYPQRLKP